MSKTIYTFYCYARKDADLRRELEKHLRPLERIIHIIGWSDQSILPGATWEEEIDKHLNDANLILLLISPDFLDSEKCRSEMEKALQRHRKGDVHVIPIILRPATWKWTSLVELQALPTDGIPITKWSDKDEAFQDVVHGIARILVEEGALSPKEASILDQSDQPTNLPSVAETLNETARKDWESDTFLDRVRIRLRKDRQESLKGKDVIPLTLHDSSGVPLHLPQLLQHLDKMANELLILGDLGSGKSLLLLDLALGLYERAKHDEHKPMPVVLNLVSWVKRRQPIAEWLIEELTKGRDEQGFEVPRKICQKWMRDHQILLLLDGLEEVHSDQLDACIEAIDNYRKQNRIIVCCRSADHQDQHIQLHLDETFTVQPLTFPEIDRYITNAGRSLLRVREVLQNTALQGQVTTPLMLSVLIEACQEMKVTDDLRALESSGLQQKLLENYVQRMTEHQNQAPEPPSPYTSKETRERLSWLAWELTQHKQEFFFIKQIQPDWLATPQSWWPAIDIGLKWFVGLDCGLFAGLLSGQFFGWCLWRIPTDGIILGLVGVVLGLALGIPFSLSIDSVDAEISEKTIPLRTRLFRGLLGSLLLGFLLGWTSGLLGPLNTVLDFLFILINFCIFIYNIFPPTLEDPVSKQVIIKKHIWYDIQDARPLAIPKGDIWINAQKIVINMFLILSVIGVVLGFFIGGGIWLIPNTDQFALGQFPPIGTVGGWLFDGLFGGILAAIPITFGYFLICGWFSCTISKDHLKYQTTKQDIWRCVGQCLLTGLTYGLAGGLLAELITAFGPVLLRNYFGIAGGNLQDLMIQLTGMPDTAQRIVFLWPPVGLLLGLLLSVLFGGAGCMRHMLIRTIMYFMKNIGGNSKHSGYTHYIYIPHNRYNEFLNYGVRCCLLRKTGEGYCFIHPLLQQFFAEEFETLANASGVQAVPMWQRLPTTLTGLPILRQLRKYSHYFYIFALILLLGGTIWRGSLYHLFPEQFTVQETLSSDAPQHDGLVLTTAYAGSWSHGFSTMLVDYTLVFTNSTCRLKDDIITIGILPATIIDSQGNVFNIQNDGPYTFLCLSSPYLGVTTYYLGHLSGEIALYRPGGSISPIQGLTITEAPVFRPSPSADNQKIEKAMDKVAYQAGYTALQRQGVVLPNEETVCGLLQPQFTASTIILPFVACAAFRGDPLAALTAGAEHAGQGDHCTLSSIQLDTLHSSVTPSVWGGGVYLVYVLSGICAY